jgi:hypothetical protein
MPRPKRTPANRRVTIDVNEEGANALLAATFRFLRRNKFSKEWLLDFARKYATFDQTRSVKVHRQIEKMQEDMGTLLATWFTNPKFLDRSANPLPLSIGKGPDSIAQLIRVAGVQVRPSVATELMRQSPSFKLNSDGTWSALRRLFVMPGLEILRAAFVVERYLDTVLQITRGRRDATPMLLERSCYVSEIDLTRIAALIRDIASRSTAFMDSIDGELEGRRVRRTRRNNVGELGVHIFVWMKQPALASKKR